jgi:hypothetical protein
VHNHSEATEVGQFERLAGGDRAIVLVASGWVTARCPGGPISVR